LAANEPFLFLAFALEYARIFNGGRTHHLPIYIDGTCNGLQHLSSLIREHNLAKYVNLLKSSEVDKPGDIYSHCADLVKAELHVSDYPNLGSLPIDRAFVKTSIMTIPYSVTLHGVRKQIEEHFNVQFDPRTAGIIYYKHRKSGILITNAELTYLSKVIYNILFKENPALGELNKYFQAIAKLLATLNLGVVWITPNGLEVKQKYTKFDKKLLAVNLYKNKLARHIISIPTSDLNKVKQAHGLLPNFIHSLDASTIQVLVNRLGSIGKSGLNLVTIHDCFGSTADTINLIKAEVKSSFVFIYSDQNILINFTNIK